VYATTNYYGYVKNISVNNPVGGEMVGASALFAGQMASYLEQAGQLTAAAEQAAAAGNQDLKAVGFYATGPDTEYRISIQPEFTGEEDLAQQYSELAQKAGAAAKQMGTLAVATEDVTLNCDQTGWGFTPIIGLDYKIGKFNFGAKYEFKTKIRLDNRAANSESAERLAMLDKFRDGRTVKEDIPALLTLGAQYEILPSLRIMAGYHHYFDKQASQEGGSQKLLKSGSREFLAGVEYDITDRVQASAGWQNTYFGLTDEYMKDMSFNVSSNSLGVGLGIQATKRIKVNVAYFHTFYKDYNRATNDYNGISATVATAAGQATADALVASGMLKGSDSFTRTNKVFGLGIDFSF